MTTFAIYQDTDEDMLGFNNTTTYFKSFSSATNSKYYTEESTNSCMNTTKSSFKPGSIIDLNVNTSALSFGENKENIDPLTGKLYPVQKSHKSKLTLDRAPLKDLSHLYAIQRPTKQMTETNRGKKIANKTIPSKSNNPLSPSALYLR